MDVSIVSRVGVLSQLGLSRVAGFKCLLVSILFRFLGVLVLTCENIKQFLGGSTRLVFVPYRLCQSGNLG